jgi:hypothetical protein
MRYILILNFHSDDCRSDLHFMIFILLFMLKKINYLLILFHSKLLEFFEFSLEHC